ncbi:uncharacterized protein F54H12.2-like [Centruroides vittatus]|uniref:uncharacterized protein F54H12.2-like n=1 Tax=Centruroides vittatus TaxID=120091 RepID=UPI00351098F2
MFRQAIPILKDAGKYIGKKALNVAKEIGTDLLSGKPLKDAALSQIKSMGKEIKDDLAVENTIPSIFYSIATITDQKSPIEFLIPGSGESLIDLSSISINAQLSFTKQNGTSTLDTDLVTPVNNLLHNTAGFLNKTDPIKDAKNEGLITKFKKSSKSQVLDLNGRFHFDFINQPKLLINGIDVRIKLERSKDAFALIASGNNYQIRLKNITLKVNKVEVSPSILIGMEKALENYVIKMPYQRVDIKVFTLNKSILSSNIANAITGRIPKRIIIKLVRNDAFNGQLYLNPFNFENFDLNYISVIKDSILIPSTPYTPDFDEKSYARSYATLFKEMGEIPYGKYANILYSDYA